MLMIQPRFQKTAFTERLTPEEIQAKREEAEYNKTRRELEEQRNSFEEIANGDDVRLPKTAKKILKGGTVITTGLLGGMATGWGAKKSIAGLEKLYNNKSMKDFRAYTKSVNEFVKDTLKTTKVKFVASDVYKKPASALDRFAQTRVGKPIAKFFKGISSGIKAVYDAISSGVEFIYNKIRGVKKETWEKVTTNTLGTSGGIAAGLEALKEQNKDGK